MTMSSGNSEPARAASLEGGGGLVPMVPTGLGGLIGGRSSLSSQPAGGASTAPSTVFASHAPSSLAMAAGSAVVSTATLPTTASPGPAGVPHRRFDEDVQMPLIKVVVLGAPGVGKTSVVKRFVSNDFSSDHIKTTGKSEFYPTLILNDSIFELKIIDLPPIQFFPASSDAEWRHFRYFGLRAASAYLLVYDVSRPSTFQYIKSLRDQMIECRDMSNVPVIVAANKTDLAAASITASAVLNQREKDMARVRKDIAQVVRKSWRSVHVECSAKFNWNIVTLFREMAVTLDMVAHGQTLDGSQGQTKKKRCLVF